MEYFNLGLGIFFIIIGFLTKKYPMMIAGYNTMSEEQKKNVDVDGLSTLLRNCFIVMGGIISVGYLPFKYLGWDMVADSIIFISVFSVLPFLIFKAQKYDHNSRDNKTFVVIAILLVIGVIIGGALFYSIKTPEIQLNNRILSVSGIYGIDEEIVKIELLSACPRIEMKTNGFNFGETLKGNFKLEGLGKTRLFLESSNKPFILVTSKSGSTIIINRETGSETEELFNLLKDNLD